MTEVFRRRDGYVRVLEPARRYRRINTLTVRLEMRFTPVKLASATSGAGKYLQ
jgi:hypothetical protein